MPMKSAMRGAATSAPEVIERSDRGFTLRLGAEELFVSFLLFPWFRDVAADALRDVEQPSPQHLYWPILDIDLAVDSIRDPERFPLVSNARG